MRKDVSVKILVFIGALAEIAQTASQAQGGDPNLTPSPFGVYAAATTSSVSTGGGNAVAVPATNYDRESYIVTFGHPVAFTNGGT